MNKDGFKVIISVVVGILAILSEELLAGIILFLFGFVIVIIEDDLRNYLMKLLFSLKSVIEKWGRPLIELVLLKSIITVISNSRNLILQFLMECTKNLTNLPKTLNNDENQRTEHFDNVEQKSKK